MYTSIWLSFYFILLMTNSEGVGNRHFYVLLVELYMGTSFVFTI